MACVSSSRTGRRIALAVLWPGVFMAGAAACGAPEPEAGGAAREVTVEQGSVPIYPPPGFGFEECESPITPYALQLDSPRPVVAVVPALHGCRKQPFDAALGLYVGRPGGWALVFTGDYFPPVTQVDRGGGEARVSIAPRTDGPSLRIVVTDGVLRLVAPDGDRLRHPL